MQTDNRPTSTLSDLMDFDHVIQVHPSGEITHPTGIYAPELHDGQIESAAWTLLSGFSGQYNYSGPIMHPSEYIGGGLETYIRSNPGFYVSLVDYPLEDDAEPEGWAIAFLPANTEGAES